MNRFSKVPLGRAPLSIIDGDRGSNYPKKADFFEKGNCWFLNTSNVTSTGFDYGEMDFITAEKDAALGKGRLRLHDIVLTTRGTIGNCAYFGKNVPYEHIRINSGMVILRADPTQMVPYFLYGFLRSAIFKIQTGTHASGSAQPQLPIGTLRNIVIPLFELPHQRKIAAVLSALDAKIELNQRINAELEGMAKLLYDYWFVQYDFPMSAGQSAALGKPRLAGQPYRSSGGPMVYDPQLKREIPKGWRVGNLESLGEIVGGSTPSTKDASFFTKEGTPWITPKDLSRNVGNKFITRGETDLTNEGVKSASLTVLPAGSVLMSSRAPIGYLAINRVPVTTNQGFKSLVPSKGYPAVFVFHTLNQIMGVIEQNASGSTFKEVSAGTLKTIQTQLPESETLKAFETVVGPIFRQQDTLEQQNHELASLRDWLLPMLMNGQVRVG